MNLNQVMVVLQLFLIYWLVVVLLDRKGILERFNISAYGPVLMIRTKRGERSLERLARGALRERFWRMYADIGTILVVIAMVLMVVLVAYGTYATFVMQPEPTALNEPRNWLLIPGLNEFIPMLAWVGFVIALVVHELAHAVLSTVEKIKVKSMGLLVALIPIGAFAEPDSEQLFGEKSKEGGKKKSEAKEASETETVKKKVATSRERTRILSAGVTSNFCVAFIAFLLFFTILFSVQPVSENGLFVYAVAEGSPAEQMGIESEMFITLVDDSVVTSVHELNEALEEKEQVMLMVVDKSGKAREITVNRVPEREGVMIVWVEEGLPAAKAGLNAGMRITRMDTMRITRYEDFRTFMDGTKPAQVIEVQTDEKTVVVELTESPYGEKGYLGILVTNNPLGMVVAEFPAEGYLDGLRGIPSSFMTFSPHQWLNSWLWLTIMPIASPPTGFGGFHPLLVHLYEPVGVASLLFGRSIFWIADVIFWVGWINFYVGLFNCLPALPLDGGYVFKEMLNPILRGIKEEERKEKIARAIASLIAFLIFSSIFFMLAGPYLL
jgi:membrane-associated protease RseP (regulator of RpoE activity)